MLKLHEKSRSERKLYFRQISDISRALLCIVLQTRNERRLLGYIDQLLIVALEASNQGVGSSTNVPGAHWTGERSETAAKR